MFVCVGSSVTFAQSLPTGSVALVNGRPLSEALLDINLRANIQRGQPDTPQIRAALVQEMIGQEVLAQEAQKLKLDQTPEARARFAQMQQNFLVSLLLENFSKTNPVTPAQVQKEYDIFLKEMAGARQYKLGVITVDDQNRAKEIIAELQRSSDAGLFGRLARTESTDPSRQDGGDLGWLLPQQMVPSVGNVVVNLANGKLSAVPIQTGSGWNVIRIEDSRAYVAPKMADIEPQLRRAAAQKAWSGHVQALRNSAKIIQ